MPSNHRALVTASLAADALALGAHWIYDTRQIDDELGRMDSLRAPLSSSFHAGKARGDQTHYGDQAVLLLHALTEQGDFSLETFARAWRRMFADYEGYRDHATKDTLQRFESGWGPEDAGSASTDLGGAARMAPLVFLYQDNEDALVAAVRRQTAMTHQNALVVESAAFFARTTHAVLQGFTPLEALQEVGRRYFDRPPFDAWLAKGLASRENDTRKAIADFGQACSVEEGFPGVVHLIAKYEQDPREGLVANVMAGGDSAARGLLVGMIMGAFAGDAAVSEDWVQGLNCLAAVQKDLETLADIRSGR